MRLDNKGFAISSILYSILIMAIMLILGSLFTLSNRKVVFDELKHDIQDRLNDNVSKPAAIISVSPLYVEADFSGAYDPLDGISAIETINGVKYNITDNILYRIYTEDGVDVTTTFSTLIPGQYTIRYDVLDSNNNLAQTKNRTLIVSDYNIAKGVNVPKMVSGMTPIKWNGTTWVNTTVDDDDWYNYLLLNWANAKTADGSMWVWIPRYIYKISSGWNSNTTGFAEIQFSKGTKDNWNNAEIGNINNDLLASASNNSWTNHPAFTFGDTELTGIWVAKFEATAAEGVVNGYMSDNSCPSSEDNVDSKNIKIIPNATSWRCISIGNSFSVSRNMETSSIYGWGITGAGIDTHMMKNIEWGAVAYLTQSYYGRGRTMEEPVINNAQTYTTGCAGNTMSASGSTTCQNTYETTMGTFSSTTGTIYGVYDMRGGAWERTAAYINNNSSNLMTNGASLINAQSKYKDIYTVTTDSQVDNYNNAAYRKGDALYETSSSGSSSNYGWYNNYANMPVTNYAWFNRGGDFNDTSYAGLFNFNYSYGAASSTDGFRPVLLVSRNL